MRYLTLCMLGLGLLAFPLARPAAAASRPTWKLCVLHYGPHGGFHDKECHRYILAKETRRPIGHTWHRVRVSRSTEDRITWPAFQRPQPRYALPGCPYAIARWAGLVVPAARMYGVPVPVMTGVMQNESRGDPRAYNPSSGASGLYQFIPSTASYLGINPWDPTQATYAAARYIAGQGINAFSGGGYGSAWYCD